MEHQTSTRRVLIVDDDAVTRIALSGVVRRCGGVVATAIDGEEALEAVARTGFDLVLVDLNLPGINGFEAARRIRQVALGRPAVLAISASSDPNDLERACGSGIEEVLVKPITATMIAPYLDSFGRATPHKRQEGNESLDQATFSQFRSDVGTAGGTPFDALLAKIIERLRSQLDAVAVAPRAEAATLAHTLRASAAWIGARALAQILSEMEALARSATESSSTMDGLARAARIELANVESELARLMS